MKVIVTGGRDFDNGQLIYRELDRLGITSMATGGCDGVDVIAEQWALGNRKMGIPPRAEYRTYQADWKTHGKAAGPIRNQQMLDEFKPDAVVAFPGGRGTADMVRRAEKAGVKVIHLGEPDADR